MRSTNNSHPPLLAKGDTVILFDGTCKLCNGWARFVIAHDQARRMRLATVQSPEGQQLLAWAGLPTDEFNTIVLVHNDQFFIRSQAMFEIFRRLPVPWNWLRMGRIVPARMRDWMYDKIALNRYRLFGRYDSSRQPSADYPDRFLKAGRRRMN